MEKITVFTKVGFKNMHYKDAPIWMQPHTITVPVSHCNQAFNVIYKKIELFTFATYLMASSFVTVFESVKKLHTNSFESKLFNDKHNSTGKIFKTL